MSAEKSRPQKPILIVEDDRDSREALREVLEDAGFAVTEAHDGRQALDQLIRSSDVNQPGLVVLDVKLPVMSGWELLAIMKSYVRLSEIPVVLVSGERLQPDLIKHGAVAAFVQKPFDAHALTALIAKHFRTDR